MLCRSAGGGRKTTSLEKGQVRYRLNREKKDIS